MEHNKPLTLEDLNKFTEDILLPAFSGLSESVDKRFDAVENRLDKMEERFDDIDRQLIDIKSDVVDVKSEIKQN